MFFCSKCKTIYARPEAHKMKYICCLKYLIDTNTEEYKDLILPSRKFRVEIDNKTGFIKGEYK